MTDVHVMAVKTQFYIPEKDLNFNGFLKFKKVLFFSE